MSDTDNHPFSEARCKCKRIPEKLCAFWHWAGAPYEWCQRDSVNEYPQDVRRDDDE